MGRVRSWVAGVLVGATVSACAPLGRWVPPLAPADERMARSVTIVRDEWGVPTIFGPTDAAVVFGIAWAQAEDNYWQIEEDYIHALGWASAYYGERHLRADLVKGALEVVRYSREEYVREPAERRALWDAWAAGLNYYLRTTGERPRVITRWEPWMVFARVRAAAAPRIDGVAVAGVGDVAQRVAADGSLRYEPVPAGTGAEDPDDPGQPDGSMWAVAPSRTEAGHALLLHNRLSAFFGSDQPYELHVHSGSGWHVRGFAILGTPIPRAGHGTHHAWSHANSAADHAVAYDVAFDHPNDPLAYRFDGEWRRAAEWDHEMYVNTPGGVERRTYRLRRTHHGPIVQRHDSGGIAVRIPRMQEGGALQQSYALGRAARMDEFMAALDQRALVGTNTMYADAAGNILYVHGNAVPRRDTTFEWSRPVSGNTVRTEWQGYHDVAELPQLLNPPSGWLHNAGSTPFLAAGEGVLDAQRYPRYMALEEDNARAASARRLLAGTTRWVLEEWAAAAFDTYISAAADRIPELIHEWEDVGGRQPRRAEYVDEAVDMLRAWDRRSTAESPEMTVFMLWQERLRSGRHTGPERHFRAMEETVDALHRDHGRVRVPWGDINRLQRVHSGASAAFDGDAPSLAVAGAPDWTGSTWSFHAPAGPRGLRFGTFGSTWVGIVELAPQIRSRSIVPFGQSAHRDSPHWFDQAPLYVRAEMKHAWFSRADVMANARRTYRPGTQ